MLVGPDNTLLIPHDLGGPYEVDLDRIKTERQAMEWVHHICGKRWATAEIASDLIEAIYKAKGWDLFRDAP